MNNDDTHLESIFLEKKIGIQVTIESPYPPKMNRKSKHKQCQKTPPKVVTLDYVVLDHMANLTSE